MRSIRVRVLASCLSSVVLALLIVTIAPPARAQTACPGGCNDQNPCTTDTCDPVRGCLHAPTTAPCSDGNTCTTNDSCQNGICVGGANHPSCSSCQAVTTLPAVGGTFLGMTSGRSFTGGSGTCSPTTLAPERVYRWTPAVSGTMEISTCGTSTNFDTVVYVRRGTCVGQQAGCNDDGCANFANAEEASRILMDVTAGQTYYVFVDGFNNSRGTFALTIRPAVTGVCGNGVRQGTEQCDGADGAASCPSGRCASNCTCAPIVCGDGIRQGTEQCDRGDAAGCPSRVCTASCTCAAATCGDGVRQSTEQCDGADLGNCTSGCTSSCTCVPPCGAVEIPAEGGTFTGVTSGTNVYNSTCGVGATGPEKLYRWIAPRSGMAVVETCGTGTSYDTFLHVRRDACTGQDIACNDDAPCATANSTDEGSRVPFQVVAGTAYFIFVDGYNGARGSFALTVRPPVTAACGDGVRQGSEQCDLADAVSCPSRQCYPDCTCIPPSAGRPDLVPEILTPYLEFQTSVPAGDVSEQCASNTSNVDLFRFGVRVFNRGTADLFLGDPMCPVCADHPGEVCDNPHFVCAPAGGHGHPHYENYAAYDLLSPSGTVVVAGHKQGFCLHDGFDSGVTCPNRHFDSCDYQGLSIGCADLYEATLGCQYVEVTGLPSGNYTLRVTVDPLGQITEDNESNNVVTLPVTIPDANCGALDIPSQGGVVNGVTSGASAFGSTCGGGATGPEKVFRWVAPRAGTAVIETCGSGTDYDTVLHVRKGACVSSDLACNDDAPCATASSTGEASRISFTVEGGATYYVFVDGYNGAAGRFSLRVTPP